MGLVFAAAFAVTGCDAPPAGGGPARISPVDVGSGSGLSSYKARKLAEISPYDDARRWESYGVISDLYERLWRGAQSQTDLATARTTTFSGYPNLVLQDRDDDGAAEFFSYLDETRSGQTREFGVYFDLGGDGRPDWIVFNGGPAMAKDISFFFWNHQAIDRNQDGRFDVYVVDLVDRDGDGIADEGVTAWIYDDDFDGRVDRGEHIVGGRITPIAPDAGALNWRFMLGSDRKGWPQIGDEIWTLFDLIARDIGALSEG